MRVCVLTAVPPKRFQPEDDECGAGDCRPEYDLQGDKRLISIPAQCPVTACQGNSPFPEEETLGYVIAPLFRSRYQ